MSLRLRLTVMAGVLFAVALVAAGALMLQVVERQARAAALEVVDVALAQQAAAIGADAASITAVNQTGAGVEFGLFKRDDELARGPMFIDGEKVAIVELNVTNGEVNQLIDPVTNGDVTDPEVLAAADELVFATKTLVGGGQGRLLVGATPPTTVEVSTAAARRALLLVFPPVLLVAVALTWVLIGRTLEPVEAITHRAAEISTDNLDERVPIPRSGDEIGRLATTINEMLDRLQRGDRRLRQFSADVSHELRSPLATVKAAGGVIARHPDRAEQLAPEIIVGADRIEGIIDDLLALALLEHHAGLVVTPTNIGEIAAESVADHNDPTLSTTGGQVSVEVHAPNVVTAPVNATQLRRAIDNLVVNATRHAATIARVTVDTDADMARIIVEDDGSGVPEDQRDSVFDRFVRLDDARARADGGAGLGLSIVHAVATAHEGWVELTSSPDLGGARVTIGLPTGPNP